MGGTLVRYAGRMWEGPVAVGRAGGAVIVACSTYRTSWSIPAVSRELGSAYVAYAEPGHTPSCWEVWPPAFALWGGSTLAHVAMPTSIHRSEVPLKRSADDGGVGGGRGPYSGWTSNWVEVGDVANSSIG